MKKICLFIFLMLLVSSRASAWTVYVPETKIGGNLTVTGTTTLEDVKADTDSFNYQQIAEYRNVLDVTNGDCVLLLGWFNPADNGTEEDFCGTGHTITYTDASDFTSADKQTRGLSYYLDMDGVDDEVTIADHNDFSFGDSTTDVDFSIGFWIYADNYASVDFVRKRSSLNDSEYQFLTATDNALQINIVDDTADARIFIESTTELTNGQWYFLVFVWDNADDTGGFLHTESTIYINGVADVNFTEMDDVGGTYVAMDNRVDALVINAGNDAYKIGKIFITKEALTAIQVKTLYEATRGYY